MKQFYVRALMLALAIVPAMAQEPGQSFNMTLFDHLNPVDSVGLHAALWGYVAPDGREYALFCSQIGVHIVDITEKPIRQVAYIGGPRNQWREVKVYKQYAYIISESVESGGGLQIVDLSNLPGSAQLVRTDTSNFKSAHTVFVRDHYLYVMGTGAGAGVNGGAMILDLEPDPTHPRRVGMVNPYYYHDAWVRNDTLLGAAIYGQGCDIYDIRDKANPQHLATITYPFSGTHNAEITSDGGYVVTSDEIGFTPKTMKVWDIRDLNNITKVADFTPDPDAIVHNVHVVGRYIIAAWYTAGVRIIDMIDPRHPREVGYYDTYPQGDGGYNGVWEVYGFFPSGKIIASDRSTGLYVTEFNQTTAGSFSGVVKDGATGNILPNVTIQVPEMRQTLVTDAAGRYYLGGANGQQATMQVNEFRYAAITENVVFAGDQQKDITLTPHQLYSATIEVQNEQGEPINPFEYAVEPYYRSGTASGPAGLSLPRDSTYTLTVGSWGYRVQEVPITLSQDGARITVTLQEGYSDNGTLDLGWSFKSAGDAVVRGEWVRMIPYTVFSGSGWLYPETEPSGIPGGYVFQTGAPPLNAPPRDGDVTGGYTTLTSPTMNLSGMPDPTIEYDQWFVHYAAEDIITDSLTVQLSDDNGITWKTVYWEIVGREGWKPMKIRVAEHMTPTKRMQVRFRVSDVTSTVVIYAAMDNFVVDPGIPSSVPGAADHAAAAVVSVVPNPMRTAGAISLDLPSAAPYLRVELFNALGEQRKLLHEGALVGGNHLFPVDGDLASGSYVVRVSDRQGRLRSAWFQVVR